MIKKMAQKAQEDDAEGDHFYSINMNFAHVNGRDLKSLQPPKATKNPVFLRN